MAKNDNLTDFLIDVADAIRAKKGTTNKINPQDFSAEISSIEGGGGTKWTGHADAEGLKAIGWTDEDIAYYQENGVNWNAEDDEYHKVPDDNKALYGVMTADNIVNYKTLIVYLPKIDTSAISDMTEMFKNCYSLVSIPQLDTSNVTNMNYMFYECYSLVSIPQLDASNVTSMTSMFRNCYSLVSIPQLDTSNVTSMTSMFYNCYSLVSIPQLDTSNVTNMVRMFNTCYSLVSIPQLDTSNVTSMNYMFYECKLLIHANIKNSKLALDLGDSNFLGKESLLYIINNEASTSAITITLGYYTYPRLAEDVDIVSALTNHPNISLARG
jgi:surface protein